MRSAGSMLLLIVWGSAAGPAAASDRPGEVSADTPSSVAVTVYRSPLRASGSIDLDRLGGFALVSETREVHLPAGDSRLRFEGVADGIEPASAIVTGLSQGVLEKNRDAALLSPSALVAAALGRPVELVRTNSRTGKTEGRDATILADAGGGVVFKTAEGVEALRCSGLAETFRFENAAGLASRPTLSVLVRTAAPITAEVTLSYLTRGFDWGADYAATVAADGKHMDLGAWVTLANGNGVGFPDARTQVVAGRVNRESGNVEPIDLGERILATCWPRGSTSDMPEIVRLKSMSPLGGVARLEATFAAGMPAAAAQDAMVSAQRVIEEQLGDLKLYRVPEPTTVAARQSKQVRLLDKSAIPIDTVYGAELSSADRPGPRPASRWLRSKNDGAHHLGVPLPSGTVAVFALHRSDRLLVHEARLRDLALDEDLEIDAGTAADVEIDPTQDLDSHRVNITNARPEAVQFELKLRLDDGVSVKHADQRMATKNGRPIFRLTIPARSAVSLHYETTKR